MVSLSNGFTLSWCTEIVTVQIIRPPFSFNSLAGRQRLQRGLGTRFKLTCYKIGVCCKRIPCKVSQARLSLGRRESGQIPIRLLYSTAGHLLVSRASRIFLYFRLEEREGEKNMSGHSGQLPVDIRTNSCGSNLIGSF